MASMTLKIKSKLLGWCLKPCVIRLLSASPPVPHVTLLLAHMYQRPRCLFCPSNVSRLLLPQGFGRWPQQLFPQIFFPGWILAHTSLFKRGVSSIPTYLCSLHVPWLYYMHNSHYCLESLFIFLLTCLSISALTIYWSRLMVRAFFLLLCQCLGEHLAHYRYSIVQERIK